VDIDRTLGDDGHPCNVPIAPADEVRHVLSADEVARIFDVPPEIVEAWIELEILPASGADPARRRIAFDDLLVLVARFGTTWSAPLGPPRRPQPSSTRRGGLAFHRGGIC
jgi:hypothetical protein